VTAVALQAPAHYRDMVRPLPPGARISRSLGSDEGFIHIFAVQQHRLAARMPALKKALAKDGMLWVSWPKRGSSLATDLDESSVRAIGLAAGLVDVKVCAVDAVWSGLKFVYRLRDR